MTFRAKAATPFCAVFAHENNDAIAHLKQSLLQYCVLAAGDLPRGRSQFRRRFHGSGDSLQRALQIRNRHPDLVEIVATQCCGEFGAGQRSV